jgi:hypothetical protein
MNLIEIAEDLKDLPDQYLMQEIQQPTGNFPSYLIVSELGRRKRMRDKVAKEMPSQTVAQELSTPPQMPQQMPQGMAPQGLMAMPQAQTELAAQDAMGTTPPEMMMPAQQMAGGGIVSFRDGGDVIRAANGFPEEMFQGAASQSDQPTMKGLIPAFTESVGKGYEVYEDYFRGGIYKDLEQLKSLGYTDAQISQMSPEIRAYVAKSTRTPVFGASSTLATPIAAPADAPAAAPAGAPPAPEGEPAAGSTFRDQISQILSREPPAPPTARYSPAGLPAFASAEERNAARERKIAEFEQAVPDRATPFYQEDIARREKDIEGRRESNINQALIRAGLGIADKGIIKGAGEGLDSYQQGAKDIRQSEEAIRAARAKMIESQTLRDQGKFGAGKEARAEAKEDYDRALSLYNTVDSQRYRQAQLASENYRNASTDFANRQRVGLEALKIEQEARLNPLREQYLRAQIAEKGRLKTAELQNVLNARTQIREGLGITLDEYNENPAKKRQVDEAVANFLQKQGFAVPDSVAPRQIEYPG